jgi:hypothetical protein
MSGNRCCLECNAPLPEGASPRRRYCTDACRAEAHRRRERVAREQALAGVVTSEEGLVSIVEAAAVHNWRAGAWLLERRWPERWTAGRRQVEVVEHDDPGDPFAEVDQLAEQRRRRLERDGR